MTELPKVPSVGPLEVPPRPTFGEYKELGGEMEEDKFAVIEAQRGNMTVGLKEILSLNMGLPTLKMATTYSKIRAEFPDKNKMWVFTETYLYLGKK